MARMQNRSGTGVGQWLEVVLWEKDGSECATVVESVQAVRVGDWIQTCLYDCRLRKLWGKPTGHLQCACLTVHNSAGLSAAATTACLWFVWSMTSVVLWLEVCCFHVCRYLWRYWLGGFGASGYDRAQRSLSAEYLMCCSDRGGQNATQSVMLDWKFWACRGIHVCEARVATCFGCIRCGAEGTWQVMHLTVSPWNSLAVANGSRLQLWLLLYWTACFIGIILFSFSLFHWCNQEALDTNYLITGNLVCISRKPFAVEGTKECCLDVILGSVLYVTLLGAEWLDLIPSGPSNINHSMVLWWAAYSVSACGWTSAPFFEIGYRTGWDFWSDFLSGIFIKASASRLWEFIGVAKTSFMAEAGYRCPLKKVQGSLP